VQLDADEAGHLERLGQPFRGRHIPVRCHLERVESFGPRWSCRATVAGRRGFDRLHSGQGSVGGTSLRPLNLHRGLPLRFGRVLEAMESAHHTVGKGGVNPETPAREPRPLVLVQPRAPPRSGLPESSTMAGIGLLLRLFLM
jgi:hypothetical protein